MRIWSFSLSFVTVNVISQGFGVLVGRNKQFRKLCCSHIIDKKIDWLIEIIINRKIVSCSPCPWAESMFQLEDINVIKDLHCQRAERQILTSSRVTVLQLTLTFDLLVERGGQEKRLFPLKYQFKASHQYLVTLVLCSSGCNISSSWKTQICGF